ncbi:MAG: hypothetical protein LBV41_04455 [Cytophagaceae bacterium]|jgi:uncharacterized lipoprotein|nr:hypothetical protein [Cytophagaceae bacterium]
MKHLFISAAATLVMALSACSAKERTMEIAFLREGQIHKETIPLDFLTP